MSVISKEQVLEMAAVLDSRKGFDIVIIDVKEQTILADYFIVCSGSSTTQVKTLAEELEMQMGKKGILKTRIEGFREGRWIVLDFGDVLVHIFHKEEREYYDIERLWTNGSNITKYEPEVL